MAFWKFTGPNGTVYPGLGGLTVNAGDVIDFGNTSNPGDGNWVTDAGPATVVPEGIVFSGAGNSAQETRRPTDPFTTGDLGVTVYNGPTASTATAGGGAALPATVAGYLAVTISGTSYKVPYYAN